MDIHDFIAQRRYLVWYVKDPRKLSNEAIVEAVLNFGDWEDVQEMNRILGIKTVAGIFEKEAHRPRSNYHPKTRHYFEIFFHRYA